MKIIKGYQGGEHVDVTEEELSHINAFSRRPMKAEEVYLFSVCLCDNEVDRDQERFSVETLKEMAGLFVGKSGIFDHDWSAKGQNARLYRTELVVEEDKTTQVGEVYQYLKGYAYMVRTRENEGLIAEIEGGIKKEVSVGCAVKRFVCSICGQDIRECVHEKGKEYDGQHCHTILEGARDAYEFSFVAVPAQPRAGVVKGKVFDSLEQLVKAHPACRKELEELEKQARAGRSYLEGLRKDVVRLGALAEEKLEVAVLRSIAEKLEEGELLELKRTFGARAEEKFDLRTQLEYTPAQRPLVQEDGAFLI